MLAPAPRAFVDRGTRGPAFGSFEGPLPAVRPERLGFVARVARQKKWIYLAIASPETWITLAVVRTGYAATAFGFAYDLRAGRMLVDHTALGPSVASRVADDPHARGLLARHAFGGTRVTVERDGLSLAVHARIGELDVDATLDADGAPPAITAIADLGDGRFSATEKRALLAVKGRARAGGRDLPLDGATAGYDYTHGLLARRTTWRWAFGLGRDESGEPIAFNAVEGFVGEAECAAFATGAVQPIGEPRFSLDAADPMRPWRLAGDGVDLVFSPGAVHAQRTNLLVVRSRFVQPVGTFDGTIEVAGRTRRVHALPGVVEDQDVVW